MTDNSIPIRLEYVEGARGFPHYIVKVSADHNGEPVRRIVASCDNRDDAMGLIEVATEGMQTLVDGMRVTSVTGMRR